MLAEDLTQEPAAPAAGANDPVDLHAYWRTIVRRRWIVVSVFVVAVLATAILTFRQTKIYDAVCTIIIEVAAPRVLEKDQLQEVVDSGSGSFWSTREYFETQYKVITSRVVAQRVVDKLQLGVNPRFLGIERFPEGPNREAARTRRDPVAIVLRNLRVDPVKDSRIVRIRYEDPDRELAAIIANSVADAYVAETLSVKTTATANASDWLEQQLSELERKLDQSGKALYEFKRAHDIVAASWEDRQSMVSQRLTAINAALTNARLRRAELQAKNDAIEAVRDAEASSREAESLPAIASSQTIQALKGRFFDVRSECQDLRGRYLEDHPRLAECEKKLQLAKKTFDEQSKIALDTARREYQDVVKTERNLAALLNETKADAFGLNQHERDYLELKRNYDNNQRLYDLVLKRLKDTGIAGMLQVSNVRVLDRARPAVKPARPDVTKNFALAAILGVVLGVGLALLTDHLDRTIMTGEQVEERVGLTVIGIVPRMGDEATVDAPETFVHEKPQSAAAECVRGVRANLLFMSPDKPLRTLLVTSSTPGEGKTLSACSLALSTAGSGSRVLLIDADMRRPRIHRIFGLQGNRGLSSLIVGDGTLRDSVAASGIENLWILPSGPVPPNPAELLHTAAFQRLLAEASAAFDRVIIDSPPVGVVADSAIIGNQADGTVVVLRAGKTSSDSARGAVRQLTDVKVRICGAVLNDVDLKSHQYGRYAYYSRYGYYGGDTSTGEKPSRGADAA